MFKKIEIWILYLSILIMILFAIGFGTLVRQELVGTKKAGWLSKTALFLAEMPVNFRLIFNKKDAYIADRHKHLNKGFNIYSDQVSYGSNNSVYLLLSRWDGDINEGIIELIDLREYKVIHSWNPDLSSLYKVFESKNRLLEDLKITKPENLFQLFSPVLANGILYFHGNNTPIFGIDAESNIINIFDDIYHHSLELTPDNKIWATNVSCPINNKLIISQDCRLIRDENIVLLNLNGEELYKKSVTDLLYENDINVFKSLDDIKDITHINDVQPIYSKTDYWNIDDVFLSLRSLDIVLLYSPKTNQIKWVSNSMSGLKNQHDVNIISNSKISIFNNNIEYKISEKTKYRDVNDYSTVMVYDFKDNTYSSYLDEAMRENEIRTDTSGKGEITSSGGVLIEETNSGRLIYINNQGEKVWEFYNKSNNGKVARITWHNLITEDFELKHVKDFIKTHLN